MSSPFTFPSTFPNISLFPSPSPQIAPSPLAGILAQSSGQSPAIPYLGIPGSTTADTPRTPLGIPNGINGGGSVSGYGGQTSGSRAGATIGAPVEVGLDSVLGGMEEVLNLLGRLERVLVGLSKEREAVFRQLGGEVEGEMVAEGPDLSGSPARIMSLQQEYAQALLSLQPLLTSTLIGALPVPLSSASPLSNTITSDPSHPPQNSSTSTAPLPTISDLAVWAEKRAELEFSRREGVKAGAKAIVDVFKTKS